MNRYTRTGQHLDFFKHLSRLCAKYNMNFRVDEFPDGHYIQFSDAQGEVARVADLNAAREQAQLVEEGTWTRFD